MGAISDIHGNEPALEQVLSDMPEVDRLVCAGDVVGYNPWPRACIQRIRDEAIPTVQGNHDRAVATGSGFRFNVMAQAGVEYARQELNGRDLGWLETLPTREEIEDGQIAIVHGHPDDPDRYTFPDDFGSHLLEAEEVLVLGHTHVQHHEVFPEGIVVNPGSVGQPRDGDPRAAYAVIDLEERRVEEHRVEYDIDVVCERIHEAGLPRALGDRLRDGR